MKKILVNSLIVAGSIIFFFILCEIALALFSPHKLKTRPYHEKYDPIMGWVNKPLKDEGVHFEFSRNRFFHVRHNSLGLRGKETTVEKPSGTKRVLFVGDSFFWGYGVGDYEVLTEVFQKNLSPSVEALNGGVTGYGLDQSYLWLKNEGLKYRPDIVVFGFSAANDLDEIAGSFSYFYPKPIFMLEGDKLVLRNVPVPKTAQTERKAFASPPTLFGKIKKFLRYHTHTYQFIVGRLNSNPETRLLLINLGLAEEYSRDLGNIPVLTNPPGDIIKIALRLILESRSAAEGSGAKFLLVLLPRREKDPSGTVVYDGVEDFAYDQNSRLSALMAELSSDEKIPFLDLVPVVRAYHRKGDILYNTDKFDHHWTPLGHRVAAEEINAYLKKAGWL